MTALTNLTYHHKAPIFIHDNNRALQHYTNPSLSLSTCAHVNSLDTVWVCGRLLT